MYCLGSGMPEDRGFGFGDSLSLCERSRQIRRRASFANSRFAWKAALPREILGGRCRGRTSRSFAARCGSSNEGGFDGVWDSDLVTDDFEFHEPPEQPAPRVARGREEVVKLGREFDAAWEEHRSEPQEIRALDDDRVLLVSVEHFKGRDGIE